MREFAVPIVFGGAAVMSLVGLVWLLGVLKEPGEEPDAGYYWMKGARISALRLGVALLGLVVLVLVLADWS